MNKKTTRISISKFEKALDKENILSVPLPGAEDVMIEIKKTISLQSMIEFVETAVAMCVDTETGEYLPQVLDFAVKKEVLTRYANFAMPHNAAKQYELIYNTDAISVVASNINQVQFQEIITSIHRKIQFMLDGITSVAANGVTQLVARLDAMADENKAIFDAINGDDVAKMMDNLNVLANMNEGEIVQALKHNDIIETRESSDTE